MACFDHSDRPEGPSPPRESSDILARGTDSSNPLCSGGESVSPVPSMATGAKAPAFRRKCEPGRDQRAGRTGDEPARFGCFSLTGIDAVPPLSPRETKALKEKSPGLPGTLCR